MRSAAPSLPKRARTSQHFGNSTRTAKLKSNEFAGKTWRKSARKLSRRNVNSARKSNVSKKTSKKLAASGHHRRKLTPHWRC